MANIAFLFAGQGAQQVGMGQDLYETYPEVRELYDRADAAVPFDLKRICFEGPEEELTRTDVSQPAIVVCSLAALKALDHEMAGRLPRVSAAAGLSLGEYSALCFAGAVSLEDTLKLVIARGEAMQRCCEAQPSGMTSLLGLGADALGPAVEAGASLGPVGVANDNSPRQVVLSGAEEALAAAVAQAKELGAKKAVALKVAGAYHSSLMAPAGEELREVLASVGMKAPDIPVVANVNADAYPGEADAMRALLVEQVSSTVRWRESMARIFGLGVETCFEFGPGGVLKGLVRQNDRKRRCLSVLTVDDVQAAARHLMELAETIVDG